MQITKTLQQRKAQLVLLAAACLLSVNSYAQQQPTDLAFNLADPSKLAILGNGGFLTVQAGTRPNRGVLYFFDSQGDFTWVLLGLPSFGSNASAAGITAPDGLAMNGNTLYIATAPVTPNGATPAPSAQASIVRVVFSRNLADSPGPFALQPTDYQTLLDGGAVTLTQGTDNTATVTLLAASVNAPTDLSVDASTGRLYLVSRLSHTISWLPLQ
ncbi:MAG TPA: hypothetical protein VKU19_03555 [Bryobacteraceae bacterium]|nr:hypothetical protein [Bryobacteraceae bacterium]